MKVAMFFVNIEACCPFGFGFQISDISFAFILVSKAEWRRFKKEKNKESTDWSEFLLHCIALWSAKLGEIFIERFCFVVAAIWPGDC